MAAPVPALTSSSQVNLSEKERKALKEDNPEAVLGIAAPVRIISTITAVWCHLFCTAERGIRQVRKLHDLKDRIRRSNYPIREYLNPSQLAQVLFLLPSPP
jgi:hypothetical protein